VLSVHADMILLHGNYFMELTFFLVKYADGVLTDDGDVFLYGAKVVYKGFNISSSKV
jgi:hypothetical protein